MKVHRHTHYPDRLPTPAGSPGLISTTDSWLSQYVSVGVACRPEGDEHWSLIWWQIEILENDNKRKEMEILHEPLRSAPPPTTHLPSQRHTWLPLKLRLNIDANGLHQAVRGKERAEDRKGKSVNCQRVCSSGGVVLVRQTHRSHLFSRAVWTSPVRGRGRLQLLRHSSPGVSQRASGVSRRESGGGVVLVYRWRVWKDLHAGPSCRTPHRNATTCF